MRISLFAVAIMLCSALATDATGQRLPKGAFHQNYEHSYDIIHLRTEIQLDWDKRRVFGETTIKLRPLKALSSIPLDALRLTIESVRTVPDAKQLTYASTDSTLVVNLDSPIRPPDTLTITIKHSAAPSAGFYFIDPPQGSGTLPSAYTYGEGGLHANWLPLCAHPNDKFSSEVLVTVESPYQGISNGKLIDRIDHPDGRRTFHWMQEHPHSDYLMAVFVGDYDSVQLAPAFGEIPLSCWVPRGRKEEGRYAFRNTTEMVEYFSELFDYRYPWEKYDQIASYDYAIGAMENTSVTGHRDCVLREMNSPDDFSPHFESYISNWTAEATIAHELAHHWFGDNLTYRSLASLWLNESFATYSMMLWDEHKGGDEFLQLKTWLALQTYLRYVRTHHLIRPLEYRWYDSRKEIFNAEHTYLKGAIILHMLRWILGDQDFFNAMSYYLHKHQFSNVESADLKTAFEESIGKDLQYFFDEWVYSGGHPRFEVGYRYFADRKLVELTVEQTQPLVTGQGLFTLPVEIRIDTRSKSMFDTVWVENETDHFLLGIDEDPLMISFDGRGALVCELVFEKKIDELLYQLQHDALPGRFWALQQLVQHHPFHPRTLQVLRSLLGGSSPWWLKAQVALELQNIHTPGAEELLIDQLNASDYHIRKAAAIALGSHFTESSSSGLHTAIHSDPQMDVAAVAILSLAKVDTSLSPRFFTDQMSRSAWYDELRLASLEAIEEIGKEEYLPLIRDNVSLEYNLKVRQQALSAWAACAPNDPQLTDVLIASAREEVLPVREKAIHLLGELKVRRALPLLKDLSSRDGDSDIRKFAKDAIQEIRRISQPTLER